MKKQLGQVMDFHQTFGCHVEGRPTARLPAEATDVRIRLIQEELDEYLEATSKEDIVAVADALSDLLYVVLGTYITHGLAQHIEPLFDEVHRSNMSKLDQHGRPILREDGKILKSDNWSPPDLEAVLGEADISGSSDRALSAQDGRAVAEETNRFPDVPTKEGAEALLIEAEMLNPGPWVAHSRYVAAAASAISEAHGGLDPTRAEVLGLLHDIGRRAGRTSMRHILDGYSYLSDLGFDDAARICMTHSFPLQNTDAVFGEWDCSGEERAFVDEYIQSLEYTKYDKLLQLCDAIGLPSGFVLIEKRMLDVALRHGTNDLTVDKWRATFALKEEFENEIGASIYDVLPGVVENTFEK